MTIIRRLDIEAIRAKKEAVELKKKENVEAKSKTIKLVEDIQTEISRLCDLYPKDFMVMFHSRYHYYIVKKLKLTKCWELGIDPFKPKRPMQEKSDYYCSFIVEILNKQIREKWIEGACDEELSQVFVNAISFGVPILQIMDEKKVADALEAVSGEDGCEI
jgi:hypothetical protein